MFRSQDFVGYCWISKFLHSRNLGNHLFKTWVILNTLLWPFVFNINSKSLTDDADKMSYKTGYFQYGGVGGVPPY